jgi:hypothetical protein
MRIRPRTTPKDEASPPMTEEKILLYKSAQKVFEEATVPALGSTFHQIISFHFKQKFGRALYEVFVDDPVSFYNGLEEVLGAGAKLVTSLVGTFLVVKHHINYTAEEFVNLVVKGDELSKRKLKETLLNIDIQNAPPNSPSLRHGGLENHDCKAETCCAG